MACLFPGYKHVDSFEDCEYEDEEEVEYVTLDLGMVEPTLVPSSASYRLIGLDSATPFLQLSGTMLMGSYVSLLGTEMLFAEGSTSGEQQGSKSLVHIANTERRVRFKPIELKPKSDGGGEVAEGIAKTSHLENKGNSQPEHGMNGGAAPSRRGRGRGRGRGKRRQAARPTEDVVEQDVTDGV